MTVMTSAPVVGEAGDVGGSADPYAGMSRGQRRKAERSARRISGALGDYPHLVAMKPREQYVFHSDYFQVDDVYGCVLAFFHDDAAKEAFGAFWGINRIPMNLGDGVSTVLFEQVHRMGERWIEERLKSSETIGNLAAREQAGTTTSTKSRRSAAKSSVDLETIVSELQNGASYLHVHNRILIKAPSLDALDTAIDRVRRLYVDRFATLTVAPYAGEQKREVSTLLGANDDKRGKGFHYTSTEFAGSHSLVTNGLNDLRGEYVGSMVGDVNNSAVLFDVDAYENHVVVASDRVNESLGRTPEANLWGSKISQAAMLANHKTVHLVLDGSNLDALGPRFDALTARLDMSQGDVNMLEMFGDQRDEMSIFSAHLDKVVLMADQAYETTDAERSVIRGSLRDILTKFYVDKQMWYFNAKENRDRLRLVGLDHTHVPRVQDLVTYFDTAYKSLANSTARDDELLHAYSVLRMAFRDMLDTNPDLFNTYTSPEVDGIGSARRVIYDFSDLMRRGKGIAMAQLVNILGFAVGSLEAGDVLIIHGTEQIDGRVKGYTINQLRQLTRRGGRVVYLYNNIEDMLADQKVNTFDAADYTILGAMRATTVEKYQTQLNQSVPPDLEKLIISGGNDTAYLRRAHTNVVFRQELALGINPARAARRAEIKRQMPSAGLHNGTVPSTKEARR